MRASLSGVFVLALIACGGADKPGPDKPAVDKTADGPATRPEPAAPPCPRKAMVPAIAKAGDLADDDYRTAEVEACVYLAADRWFVIGSIGDHDPESQSEEGFEIVRFIAGDGGEIRAVGPPDGASWMTGVPEGKYETADLDGDGVLEVLERIDIFIADPSQATQILRVFAVRDDKLAIALSTVLADGDEEDPEGGQVCRARFSLAESGAKKTIDVEVTQGQTYSEISPDDIVLEATDGRESVQCLPVGRFRFSYAGGKMSAAVLPKKPPAK